MTALIDLEIPEFYVKSRVQTGFKPFKLFPVKLLVKMKEVLHSVGLM